MLFEEFKKLINSITRDEVYKAKGFKDKELSKDIEAEVIKRMYLEEMVETRPTKLPDRSKLDQEHFMSSLSRWIRFRAIEFLRRNKYFDPNLKFTDDFSGIADYPEDKLYRDSNFKKAYRAKYKDKPNDSRQDRDLPEN